MRKAITPVIATVLLIMIVIVVSVLAFIWITSVQSRLQERAGGPSGLGGCSRVNLISMRGDRVVIQNTGCDIINNVTLLIDGVLTEYDLTAPLAPGSTSIITYSSLEAGEEHVVKVVLDSGYSNSLIVSALESTREAGYGGCIEEESECYSPNVWFTGSVTYTSINYCACCGDDGSNDIFYNGSLSDTNSFCEEGVFYNQTIDELESVCTRYGYDWIIPPQTDYSLSLFNHPSGYDFTCLTSGDFNNDSYDDVVLGDPGWLVIRYLNNGSGGYPSYLSLGNMGGTVYAVHADFFNNDSYLDFAEANANNFAIRVFFGNGDGTFNATSVTNPLTNTVFYIDSADIDSDGDNDFFTGYSSGTFYLWRNNGDGTFSYTSLSSSIKYFDLGDIDNDGDIDVIGRVTLLNNGSGSFTSRSLNGTIPNIDDKITAADVNNDTFVDIIAGGITNGSVNIYLNNGSGWFSSYYNVGNTTFILQDIKSADLNDDNYIDIITVDRNSGSTNGTIYKWINNGLGNFTKILVGGRKPIYGLAVSDVDNDDDLDFITAAGGGAFEVRKAPNNELTGDYFFCCGDDGSLDTFSNGTYSCCAGVFQTGNC